MLPLSVAGLSPALAAQSNSLYDQTGISSGGLSTFNQLQSQQQDINALRGQIEELKHQLQEQKELSQKRYMDLEQRLSNADSQSASTSNQASSNEDNDPISTAARQGSSTAATGNDGAQQAYQDAFSNVQSRKFDEAIDAFEKFTASYPESNLNANAYYWLGESYAAKSQLSKSAGAFQTVLDKYSNSSKVPDAMYRLGLVEARLGNGSKAMALLKQVVSDYPNSGAATKSQNFIDQMR
ncbi:tol-pal system protein YbgF [Larsenimonas salina]|uniref:tol-pal system protein YbgF n=1 Tax=Larsenimonas salina TaxID=1295565 RepID=UPI00207416AD|nr:tol-pal system protein YbgF [Larsenimonas salina]MCM5703467.1 tol-pal system protein YbgF [Larsenimonas salina]